MSIVRSVLRRLSKVMDWFFKLSLPGKIAVIALILGIGWFVSRFVGGGQQQTQLTTARVEKGTIVSTVSASGQVLTANVINVTSSATGVVKQIFIADGDKITKGEKIVEIELDSAGQQRNASAWSSYLSAKNSLDSANATIYTLDSQMWAANRKFINDAVARGLTVDDPTYIQEHDDWLAAEAKYKNQQSVISQSQAALNNTWLSYQQSSPVITAPMSGNVGNVTIASGLTIGGQNAASTNGESSSSQTIAVIRNEGNPLASFNFSEIDVTKVKIGQKATVTLDAITGKTFTGKVVSIDKIGKIVSNVTNYPVIVQLDTSSEDLLPNMSATANVIIETKDNVLFVPSQAIQTVDGQATVRVLKKGQIQQVSIETGISGDQGIEIVSGLPEGDEVIVGTTGTSGQQGGTSPFGGSGGNSFGGGALRPGGFGGGSRMQQQH